MIRPYRDEDLDTIMDIGNRAWREIYRMLRARYGDELFERIVPDERTSKGKQIEAHCKQHPEWVLICEEEGRVIGFVTFFLRRDKGIGVIGNNAVDPEHRHKGIGQQMYRAALAYFRDHDMAYAEVQTGLDEAHAPARRAYERAGFDISHRGITYYMKL